MSLTWFFHKSTNRFLVHPYAFLLKYWLDDYVCVFFFFGLLSIIEVITVISISMNYYYWNWVCGHAANSTQQTHSHIYSTFIDCSSSFKSDRWAGNQWQEFQSEIVISSFQTLIDRSVNRGQLNFINCGNFLRRSVRVNCTLHILIDESVFFIRFKPINATLNSESISTFVSWFN